MNRESKKPMAYVLCPPRNVFIYKACRMKKSIYTHIIHGAVNTSYK